MSDDHLEVMRMVPVDPATGSPLDEGFYALVRSGPEGTRVVHAAPTLERLREVGGEDVPAEGGVPDLARELARDLYEALRSGARRVREEGTDVSPFEVIGDMAAHIRDSPSLARLTRLLTGEPEDPRDRNDDDRWR